MPPPNKEDIVTATLNHTIVRDQIKIQERNLAGSRKDLAPRVRTILDDIARQVAERIADKPPSTPDFTGDWKPQIIGHTFQAFPYDQFVNEMLPQIARQASRGDEKFYRLALRRITEEAGAVAGMIYHGLDPDLLRPSQDERVMDQVRLAAEVIEEDPSKLLVFIPENPQGPERTT